MAIRCHIAIICHFPPFGKPRIVCFAKIMLRQTGQTRIFSLFAAVVEFAGSIAGQNAAAVV